MPLTGQLLQCKYTVNSLFSAPTTDFHLQKQIYAIHFVTKF